VEHEWVRSYIQFCSGSLLGLDGDGKIILKIDDTDLSHLIQDSVK
jgi:hypothetical protein